MSGSHNNCFVPTVESLDDRITPSALTGTPREPLEAPHQLEGHQALVFFLGGIPSRAEGLAQSDDTSTAADGRKYKMLVAPLIIELDGKVAQQLAEGVVILTSSLPGGDANGALQGALFIAKQQAQVGNVYTVTFGGHL